MNYVHPLQFLPKREQKKKSASQYEEKFLNVQDI